MHAYAHAAMCAAELMCCVVACIDGVKFVIACREQCRSEGRKEERKEWTTTIKHGTDAAEGSNTTISHSSPAFLHFLCPLQPTNQPQASLWHVSISLVPPSHPIDAHGKGKETWIPRVRLW